MSEIFHKYSSGEPIPSSTLQHVDSGLELYGTIIHAEWRLDRARSEPDFFGEVWLTKVHPIETRPKDIHLAEVRPLNTGVTRTITTDRFDRAMETVNIEGIREELGNLTS